MLFSYQQADPATLPSSAAAFVAATRQVHATDGVVLTQDALTSYLAQTALDRELSALIHAVTDEESKKRVDYEIRRRVLTGKIPQDVAAAITEIIEILGLHQQEMHVMEVPLVVVLYTEGTPAETPVVINITGGKGLADALRLVWSKLFVSPYPDSLHSAITVFRMPSAEQTAVASLRNEQIHVQAVQGWGLFVEETEGNDTYLLEGNTLRVTGVHVGKQRQMVSRNSRTGEVVLTACGNGDGQKLTEEQVRGVAHDLKRSGASQAVFGIAGDKRWLLRVLPVPPQQARETSTTVPEPVEEEEVVDTTIPPTPVRAEYTDQPQNVQVSGQHVEDAESSVVSYGQALQLSTALLMQCIKTIELTMREWLYDAGPEDFGDLVAFVATKRSIPLHQEILTLWRLKQAAALEDPTPESVRFALETMHQFVRAF